ncbi:helix-turn-helix domain-containing protein [Aquabacterium soli]|nr:helix-turn-helix domain-containing protein [Aquabacterium soli]
MEQHTKHRPPVNVGRSTATWAQLIRTADALRTGAKHTYELRRRGISHPAGRVRELNGLGFIITRTLITTVDADGFTHNGVALYSLIHEPEGVLNAQ